MEVNMKRKLFSVILTLSLTIGMMSTFSFAESQPEKIQSLAQLKTELSEDLTKAEQTEIIERTDEEVVNEFLTEKLDKATELLNDVDHEVMMNSLPDGSAYGIETFDLGDGCILTVELRDAEEGMPEYNLNMVSMPATTLPDQWKDYGNRYFTATASATIGNVKASMSLIHRYELSASGIEAKKGDADVAWKKTGGSCSHTNPNITDRYAKTVGTSDVNIECEYYFRYTSNDKANISKYKLDTAVGFVDINKTTKRIKVRHSWNLTKAS